MARNLEWVILRPSVVRRTRRLWRQRPVARARRVAGPAACAGHRAAAGGAARRCGAHGRVFPAARRADARRARDRRAGAPVARRGASSPIARWLGWRRAPHRHACRAGWWAPPVGWAISSASSAGGRRCAPPRGARSMRGAVGDPAPWTRLTGIEPRALGAALAAEPASVQERWFARLYFAKPLTLRGVLRFLDRDGPRGAGAWLGRRRRAHPGGPALLAAPAGGRGGLARHCHRRRHRRPAHRRAGALGGAGAVDRLRGRSPRSCCRGCGPIRSGRC